MIYITNNDLSYRLHVKTNTYKPAGRGSGENRKTALLSPPNSQKNKKGYTMESEKKREYSPDDYVLCLPDGEKYIVNASYTTVGHKAGITSFRNASGVVISMPTDLFDRSDYKQVQEYEKEIQEKIKLVDSVSILGTPYKIIREKFGNEDCDGETDYTSHQIRIRTDNINEVGDFDSMMKKQLRHEIIHAFMAESGLQANFEHYRQFGHDETTVDWFAIQFPKILEVFKQVGAL